MSAYLKFFELEQSPFEGQDQSKVVLGTKALREAFASIQTGLDEGASRVFLNGGPGVGKTSFARALPKLLGDETRVAGISDPSLPWESMRGGIAMQWGLDKRGLARANLLEAAEDHRLLLVIDQAERATEEFLDHLDVLLSYKDEFADPVVQSILLGRLGGNGAESAPPLMWWLDRIQTLQLEYAPLPREGVGPYIRKHLKRAGWRGGRLFTDDAALAIHGWTGGIPADVSKLCERLLVEAADCGVGSIDASFVDLYNEDQENTEGDEEKWNFDHEFDEFENAITEEAPAQASLAEQTPSSPITDADSDGDGLQRPGLERAIEAEAELNRIDEEERVASQKAALPCQSKETKHQAPLPPLEATLEHFVSLELLNEAKENSANTVAIAEANYIDDEEGFDPNAEIDSETYAELEALEQALSAPPSSAELREIRGSFFARHAKPFILGTIAAVIGGLAFTFLFQPPTAAEATRNQIGSSSPLVQLNGPAESMPPEPELAAGIQDSLQTESPSTPPTHTTSARDRGTSPPPSDDLLALVGPRLKRKSELSSPRLANAGSGKTRTQKQVEAAEREDIFEDLRPEGSGGTEIDPFENRNR